MCRMMEEISMMAQDDVDECSYLKFVSYFNILM